MRKIMTIFAVIVMLAGCGEQKQTINIGFIGPLTGDAANYGKLMTQAIKIAVEEKNVAGGIGGLEIKFVPEDDEGKVEKATAAFEKLSGIDKVWGIVGTVFSSPGLAVAPMAQANKIVMITPSSTHKAFTSKGSFIFRNVLSDELQAIVFAKYAYSKMNLKKVAILFIKNDYSQGLAEDFQNQFEADGGQIVAVETGLVGDKDFKTQLTKIKGANPEALYIPNYIAEMAQIIEQAAQLGLTCKIISGDGFSNPGILTTAGKYAEGVVFANSAEDTTISGVRQAFEEKYEKKWGAKPDAFSLNSYDAAAIIISAVEQAYNEAGDADKKALNLDREKIRAYVAAVKDYPGVSGMLTFLPSRDAAKNVGIFVVEGGKYKQIGVYGIKDNQLVELK